MDNEMERSNIVELFDENENPVRFEHLMTLEHQGEMYVLLAPIDEIEDIGEDEVVILRIDQSEDEETYVGVEDEELLETIFEKYLEYAEADDEADEAFEDED